MAVNLLDNVCDALDGFPVSSLVGWLDSSVALHWIRGRGQYKLFVANRVNKILQHKDVRWRHVPSKENPADIASRGGLIDEGNQLWWNGPNWLSQFIKMVGLAISEEIIWRVKEAGMYAIMADETPDLSETEQLAMYTCSLCLEWSGRRTPFRY